MIECSTRVTGPTRSPCSMGSGSRNVSSEFVPLGWIGAVRMDGPIVEQRRERAGLLSKAATIIPGVWRLRGSTATGYEPLPWPG
jgi:hypothetical protein